jgi:hypothetical protein
MNRLLRYFTPHVFSILVSVAFFQGVRLLSSLGGACRFFCQQPVTLTMGLASGFIAAQLYRSDHPVPPAEEA